MPMSPELLARRKLETAATTARIAAVACFCLAAVLLLRISSTLRYAADLAYLIGFLMPIVIVYVGPGVTYFMLGPRFKAGQRWAVITVIVVASVQLLLALATIVAQIVLMGVNLGLGVPVVLTLLLALLIVHASTCFSAFKHLTSGPRGFEPLVSDPSAQPWPTSPPTSESAGSDWPDIR